MAQALADFSDKMGPYVHIVTKDFLFFTPEKMVILQVQVNEKDKREPAVDYMASSLKK